MDSFEEGLESQTKGPGSSEEPWWALEQAWGEMAPKAHCPGCGVCSRMDWTGEMEAVR